MTRCFTSAWCNYFRGTWRENEIGCQLLCHRAWDSRFGLQLNPAGGGWSSTSFAWVPWDERAPQRQWRFPGQGWGYGPQQWATSESSTEAQWRQAWAVLVGWGKRVADRYAAFERSRFLLREQYGRVGNGSPFAKSRILKAAWLAGAPVGGLPLPLVARRLPSPYKLIDRLTSPARRSVAARFFTGDLDIAAYSGTGTSPATGCHPAPVRTASGATSFDG